MELLLSKLNSYKLSSFYANKNRSIVLYRIFLIRRFVASNSNDENMFDILVEKAKTSPSYRMALGGNAPVSKCKKSWYSRLKTEVHLYLM